MELRVVFADGRETHEKVSAYGSVSQTAADLGKRVDNLLESQ